MKSIVRDRRVETETETETETEERKNGGHFFLWSRDANIGSPGAPLFGLGNPIQKHVKVYVQSPDGVTVQHFYFYYN